MFEVKVSISIEEAPALIDALNNLATSMSGKAVSAVSAATEANVPQIQDAPVVPPQSSQPDMQVDVQETATQAEQQVPAQEQAAPKQITLEQISNAGAKLVDAGKMQQIMALIQKYGVQAINQLNPAVYGQFAADLAALGAKFE